MPPTGALSSDTQAAIRLWIDNGAHAGSPAASGSESARRHWAFQAPVRPEEPSVRGRARVRTTIDAFILAGLEKRGLTLSPDADLVTLARRVSFDLTGLPPAPERVDRLVSDRSPRAYEDFVDELLTSPRYGERWARQWLDVAGYADSEGVLAADVVRTNAWRYRDYVIRSMNSDRPYDQFVREQLAGDEMAEFRRYDGLPPHAAELMEATGFLRTAVDATREDFLPKDFAEYQWRTLFDTEQITVSALLGLTIQCARCHDHKYEPLTQRDYYAVQAIFAGALRPAGKVLPSYKRLVFDAPMAEQKRAEQINGPIESIVKALRELEEARRKHYRNRHPKGENATDDQLKEEFPEYARKLAESAAERKEAEGRKIHLSTIRALYDQDAKPPATRILQRGDPLQEGDPVEPGVPEVLEQTARSFRVSALAQGSQTTGRRKAFAEWITQPGHPLTARVQANRVWAAYFGTGIVPTPDNFGKSGTPPSHPELLDWLATEFERNGWSMKALHRLIVTSTVYRQSSVARREGIESDPENRWLWRMTPRRLEAEAVRDSILAAAGTLDERMFGEPVPSETRKSGEVVVRGETQQGRRTIYQLVRRSAPPDFVNAFDAPVMEINCIRRARSTSATQALALMNSEFISAQAEHFARRVLSETGVAGSTGDGPRVRQAFRIALARAAEPEEADLLASFVERQRLHYKDRPAEEQRLRAYADLCQVLLGMNEFVYLD
jgi:hypothetical protein